MAMEVNSDKPGRNLDFNLIFCCYLVSVVHQSNLSIHKVSRNHMTDYICLATNNIPPDESWSVKLRVHCKLNGYCINKQELIHWILYFLQFNQLFMQSGMLFTRLLALMPY